MSEILQLINERLIDGKKTIAGIVGVFVCYLVMHFGWADPYYVKPFLWGAWGLLGIGAAKKVDKARSVAWWKPTFPTRKTEAKRMPSAAPNPKRAKR